jgi:hypothetical protein
MKAMQLLAGGFVLGSLLIANGAFADPEVVTEEKTTTTETHRTGTVSDVTSGALVVQSETAPAPVSYITKTTTYVDEMGNPVSIETVREGAPVTVYYSDTPTGPVASRVVVKRSNVVQPGTTTIIQPGAVQQQPVQPPTEVHRSTTTERTTETDD